MQVVLVSGASEQPVTTSEVKDHIGIPSGTTTFDSVISGTYIPAATLQAENYVAQKFVTQVWDAVWDSVPGPPGYVNDIKWDIGWPLGISLPGYGFVEIPYSPLSSVSGIWTTDTDNAETEVSGTVYTTDTNSTPGRVLLNQGQTWPTDIRAYDSFRVRYTCGYGAAAAVPADIKLAIMTIASAFFAHKGICPEDSMPKTSYRVLNKRKVVTL